MTDEKRELERRWLELLEKLGPEVIRARLTNRMVVWKPEVYGLEPPDHAFVVAWLAEKAKIARRTEEIRFRILAVRTLFVLIAAWIAASPVICRWLPATWTLLRKYCSE